MDLIHTGAAVLMSGFADIGNATSDKLLFLLDCLIPAGIVTINIVCQKGCKSIIK